MKSITGLHSIYKAFDIFLIDLNGVVHDGEVLYDSVPECLDQLKAAGKKIVFLSNMPRSGEIAMRKLETLGLDVEGYHILTSGDAVRAQLQNPTDAVFQNLGPHFYHFGAQTNEDLLKDLDVKSVESLDEADYILVSKYLGWDETISDFKTFLQDCLERQLPMVCVNPDVSVIHAGRKRYTAGIFGEEYERMGGKVYYYGKPHPQIYNTIFNRYGSDKKYLMIGDNLDTDIQGARQAHISSLLVLTGNTGDILEKEPEFSLKQYIKEFEKPSPTYVAPRLIW